MEFKVIDCCPAPAKLYPVLFVIKQETGCTYASVYRGEDPKAAKYLTGAAPCYKHNQAWIYANYPPGVANPPGRSTHELFDDGVAYGNAPGTPLKWWQCGIDVDDAHVQAFCDAARRHHWIATITYPGSAVEYHHVNFRKLPILFINIKRGSSGKRVTRISKELRYIHSHKTGQPYFKLNHPVHQFGPKMEEAVKAFQADHHLHPDGIVGAHTDAQIAVSFRRQYKHDHGHTPAKHNR